MIKLNVGGGGGGGGGIKSLLVHVPPPPQEPANHAPTFQTAEVLSYLLGPNRVLVHSGHNGTEGGGQGTGLGERLHCLAVEGQGAAEVALLVELSSPPCTL